MCFLEWRDSALVTNTPLNFLCSLLMTSHVPWCFQLECVTMQDFKKENLIGVQWLLAFPLLANYRVVMSEFCRKSQGTPKTFW